MKLWGSVLLLALSFLCVTSAQAADQFYAVGDSIAVQIMTLGMPGTAVGGRNPSQILGMINGIPAGTLRGKTVYLSSGASNTGVRGNLGDPAVVRRYVPLQIRALRAAGANVILLGVGPRINGDMNNVLREIAQQEGARFSPLTQTYDGVHAKSARELLASLQANQVSTTQPPQTPTVTVPPVTPASVPSSAPQQLPPPPTQIPNVQMPQIPPVAAPTQMPYSAPTQSAPPAPVSMPAPQFDSINSLLFTPVPNQAILPSPANSYQQPVQIGNQSSGQVTPAGQYAPTPTQSPVSGTPGSPNTSTFGPISGFSTTTEPELTPEGYFARIMSLIRGIIRNR